MKPKISNVAASIRAKLKNALKGEHSRFDALLLLYMQERLLYRLSQSKYREQFILKGGLLLFSHALMHSPKMLLEKLLSGGKYLFSKSPQYFRKSFEKIQIRLASGPHFWIGLKIRK